MAEKDREWANPWEEPDDEPPQGGLSAVQRVQNPGDLPHRSQSQLVKHIEVRLAGVAILLGHKFGFMFIDHRDHCTAVTGSAGKRIPLFGRNLGQKSQVP